MKSCWESYKGKRIFIAHYDHMTLEQVATEVKEVSTAMALEKTTTEMLVLVDTTGTLVSPEVLRLFKEVSESSSHFKTKSAILGMTGPRRVFLDIVAKFSKTMVTPFDDAQTAKDWLVA